MTTELSPREAHIVVDLCLNGGTNQEIAERLGIAPATARTHVQNVLRKTGAHSKTDLVVAFWIALTRR